jgi:hypothetical protein
LQNCGLAPLHCVGVAFGLHETHRPAKQAGAIPPQDIASCQVPLALQNCGIVPLHPDSAGLGVHATQLPSKHTGVAPLQAAAFCQVPLALQNCGADPLHWVGVEFGVQSPSTSSVPVTLTLPPYPNVEALRFTFPGTAPAETCRTATPPTLLEDALVTALPVEFGARISSATTVPSATPAGQKRGNSGLRLTDTFASEFFAAVEEGICREPVMQGSATRATSRTTVPE